MTPYYQAGDMVIYQGDCLEVMGEMPDSSIDLIAVDPPYYKVKSESWDRQWDTVDGFIEWIDRLCQQWYRLLKANGSLYVFASPKMAARVEVEMTGWFNVLNRIHWTKENGRFKQASKEIFRSYFPATEEVIFAEHYGADNAAKGESGYGSKCDELRGFVFEPLRAYLDGERKRAGISQRQVIDYLGMTGHDPHFFMPVQWKLPLKEQYIKLRQLFNNGTLKYLRREYEDLRREYEDLRREYEDLRREYEDLRREYEDLRRPFQVSAEVPYTDVWSFPTVKAYPGKHPCEKPLALMEHIVRTSSRPGATVLDCCMGSGTTLLAAQRLGRRAIGIELSEEYCDMAVKRLSQQPLKLAGVL